MEAAVPRPRGYRAGEVERARMSAKAQERAYWTRIFTHVRQAADRGKENLAHDLLDAYLRERREKEAA
jgi:hypothetical protein